MIKQISKYIILIMLNSNITHAGKLKDLIDTFKRKRIDQKCAALATIYRVNLRSQSFNAEDSVTLESIVRTCLARNTAFEQIKIHADNSTEIDRHAKNITEFDNKITNQYQYIQSLLKK